VARASVEWRYTPGKHHGVGAAVGAVVGGGVGMHVSLHDLCGKCMPVGCYGVMVVNKQRSPGLVEANRPAATG